MIYSEDMDQFVCACGREKCDNSQVVLRSKCHNAPQWVTYVKESKSLQVVCAECNEVVVEIAVGSRAHLC